MQHTFKLVDKLNDLLVELPHNIDSDANKALAKNVLASISSYTKSLRAMVESHNTDEYLERLHASHIDKVENWADEVIKLFRKFDKLLITIEGDVKIMHNLLENEPDKWYDNIQYMALGMINTGLHDEVEEMIRFRKIAIYEEHELRSIIDAEEHIVELLS